MAVKLSEQDMRAIYEVCRLIHTNELSRKEAVNKLQHTVESTEASIKMYFDIYSSMQKGVLYKMGTSKAFTQFLLESIFKDDGEAVFRMALASVKQNAVYRESVNNAQPGLKTACEAAIKNCGLNINYDDITVNNMQRDTLHLENTEETHKVISEEDRRRLLDSIDKKNSEFASDIMNIVSKYQLINDDQIAFLSSKNECGKSFHSDYAMLLSVSNDPSDIDKKIRDKTDRPRYYREAYNLNGGYYVFTSQLYSAGGTHKDNRTPFYKWILNIAGIDEPAEEWWPSLEEYNPGITKDQWLELLKNPKVFYEDSLQAMAQYYDMGGAASCLKLSEKYGRSIAFYRNSIGVALASRIEDATSCPLCNQENSKYWPILFVGRRAEAGESGSYIWKLRDELVQALEEFDILRYLGKTEDQHQIGNFDSWEVVDEDTAIKTCDKSFFEHRGSGVPKGISWFWGAENMQPGENIPVTLRFQGESYTARVSNESSDRRRVRIFWYSDLANQFNQYRNMDDVKATFHRMGPNDYEVSIEEGESEMPLTNKETLNLIKEYIDASGFTYEDGLVENFYLSLKSKPFVILAGTSGTGKTKLVKLFSEAIGAEYKLVPVRPDWSDSSDLFGHMDLNGNFVPGPVIDFLVSARNHPKKPHLLCLDEMNLARVEYYLSDFLSIIETRKMKDGEIVSAPLVDNDKYGADADAREKYGRLEYPSNLYVVGTVNMDETTFPFSKKVLDRANTIEFSHVNLIPDFGVIGDTPIRLSVSNSFLKTDYLILKDCADQADYITGVCSELEKINQILQKANSQVGYRVRDEIIFYMLNNRRHTEKILPENDALDNEIMQKILPRIQGSSSDVYDMLCELFQVCGGDYTQKNGNSASEKMRKLLEDESNKCKYRKSAEKLKLMAQRFEQDGFTSYWL